MIADAYYFATGEGDKPREIKLFENIQTYGIQAILGRPMYYHEIQRCNVANAVYNVKMKSLDTENWAKWAEKHQAEVNVLANTEKLIAELEENA